MHGFVAVVGDDWVVVFVSVRGCASVVVAVMGVRGVVVVSGGVTAQLPRTESQDFVN